MAFSRREFVRLLGAGGAAVASSSGLIGYGREEAFAFQQGGAAQRGQRPAMTGPAPIRLSSNENLRGPSPKVIDALKAAPSRDLGLGYPPVHVADFQEAIANRMRGRRLRSARRFVAGRFEGDSTDPRKLPRQEL